MRLIEDIALEKEIQRFEYRKGIYEGEAINNVPNGNGKVTWEDDLYYEGGFLNGSFHGYGICHQGDFLHLEGIWNNHDFVEGKAVYGSGWMPCGYETGSIYEGKFEELLMVGKGKIIRKSGEIYEGDTLNGKPHGKGKLTCSDGTVIVGTWTNGNKDYEYTDEDYENAGGDARFANTNC